MQEVKELVQVRGVGAVMRALIRTAYSFGASEGKMLRLFTQILQEEAVQDEN
jgi:hypothetical protein